MCGLHSELLVTAVCPVTSCFHYTATQVYIPVHAPVTLWVSKSVIKRLAELFGDALSSSWNFLVNTMLQIIFQISSS